MKKIIIMTLSLVIGIGSVSGYINYKKYSSKIAVENYLTDDKKDAKKVEPFVANLQGDKKWLVYVRLNGDAKKYYYYKDSKNNKVVLESYILKGKEYAG
ncbi:hypothetical protein ACFX4K_26650 [Priestia sp. YIM B13484]|uniref:hypothetical protein n=1 Tax=Priestia TaxID=2800373 RepID=UPI00301C8ABB